MKSRHISEYKIKKIIEYFVLDLTATQTSKIIKISRNTINEYYNTIREAILKESMKEEINEEKEKGRFEVDESYFGARRIRGKKGRGASGKTVVFGVLKRADKVYLKIIKNASKKELMPIIRGKILEGSTIHSDGWKA